MAEEMGIMVGREGGVLRGRAPQDRLPTQT